MHPRESIIAKKTARIMRAARKRRGLTQSEIAKLLQTSQANISKLENAMLIPSAPECFEFCDVMKIPAESLRTGTLDARLQATVRSEPHEGGFRLPKRYIDSRGTSVRAVMPLLTRAEKTLGDQRLNAALESMGLDPDVTVELSNVLNANFCMDLARLLIKEGAIENGDLTSLDPHYIQPICHGSLHQDYAGLQVPEELMKKWYSNIPFYCSNFEYRMEEQTADNMTLSVKACDHMKAFPYTGDPVLGDFMCRYFKQKLGTFPTYNGAPKAKVESLACMHKGDDRCIYKVTLPAAPAA